MNQNPTPPSRLIDNTPFIVIGLLLVDSLHFVFARLLLPYLPPITSALFVLGIGTVEVAIFAAIRGQLSLAPFKKKPWFFLSIGLLVATSTVLNYAAVAYVDPGTASMLGKASVIFSLGFGLFWLRDRFAPMQFVGAGFAIIGMSVITFQPGDYLRLGSLMIVASAFMYALHAAIIKRYGADFGLIEFFLFRLMSTTAFLFVFAAVGDQLVLPTGKVWFLLILIGTVDVVISRSLYYLALRKLKLTMHAVVLTLSPVVAIGWSHFLFGTTPNLQQFMGGLAVLAGVFLVTIKARK